MKENMIEVALNRGGELKLYNPDYKEQVKIFTEVLLKTDLGDGDITSEILMDDVEIEAELYTKQPGIIAGIEEGTWFLEQHDIKFDKYFEDGDSVNEGDVILKLKGNKREILNIERILLNLMQRMSGIATLTNDISSRVSIRIACTRKAHWGYLDKKAVAVGGGLTHRLGLWESFLIKDNHLAGMPITAALEKVKAKENLGVFIEIEVKNKKETIEASAKIKELKFEKPCIIMMDNIDPLEMKEIIKELKDKNLYEHVLLEASGRIDPINIAAYEDIGLNFVSLGFLTHSPKAFDLSLRIK